MWKFLSRHLCHPVELLGEASRACERIGIDFARVDSLAAYADGAWAGETLAQRPRPLSRAIGEIVLRATDLADAGGWIGDADRAAAARLLGALGSDHPADLTVDDAALLARPSRAREAAAARCEPRRPAGRVRRRAARAREPARGTDPGRQRSARRAAGVRPRTRPARDRSGDRGAFGRTFDICDSQPPARGCRPEKRGSGSSDAMGPR
ncbi:hypothetical protein ACFYXS_10080 [Streptomyces sp. NPDC002574]|uniref:hypothetical protein n=1 Tax=Streptomyces sp. NPDC002574 TaxID=3364652 RepID=UPI00369369E0